MSTHSKFIYTAGNPHGLGLYNESLISNPNVNRAEAELRKTRYMDFTPEPAPFPVEFEPAPITILPIDKPEVIVEPPPPDVPEPLEVPPGESKPFLAIEGDDIVIQGKHRIKKQTAMIAGGGLTASLLFIKLFQ